MQKDTAAETVVIENMYVNDVYIQQNHVTCHRNGQTIGLLRKMCACLMIPRNDDYNWPVSSRDLTPLGLGEG